MVNNSRSSGIIDPSKYTGNIHVIGVGATGSRVAKGLIELGFKGNQLHIYDFDIVEEHNVNNQTFDNRDVGKLKVVAMQQMAEEGYGEIIHAHQAKVDKDTQLDGVVFLLTDTMSSRKEIVETMKINPNIKLVIETRLDPRCGYVHSFNPLSQAQYEFFAETMFDDDDAPEVVSACGTRQTVNYAADVLSGVAIWEFAKWVNESKIGNQVFFCLEPYLFQETPML